MLQVFMFDNISGAHSSQIFICNLISSLVLFLFFLQELIQMKYFGVRYYLQDVYNIIDLLFFPTQIIYFILKASDDGYSLPYLANNPEIHGGGELKYTGVCVREGCHDCGFECVPHYWNSNQNNILHAGQRRTGHSYQACDSYDMAVELFHCLL
jgi:hypothetical protein